MTADVAALASALTKERMSDMPTEDAEAIAALAAQGWRITSAPEPDPNECQMTGRHYCEPGTYHTAQCRTTHRAAEPIIIESADDPVLP